MDDEMDFEGAIVPPQQPQPTLVYPQAEPSVPVGANNSSDGNAKMLCVPHRIDKHYILTYTMG